MRLRYRITAYLNESPGHFDDYQVGHHVGEVGTFDVDVTCFCDPRRHLTEAIWLIGNDASCDDEGRVWPKDARSLSVGDVIKIVRPDEPHAEPVWLAFGMRDWAVIAEPAIDA